MKILNLNKTNQEPSFMKGALLSLLFRPSPFIRSKKKLCGGASFEVLL